MTSRDEAFHRLDPRIRKWIYQQGWTELRDIQINALNPILDGDTDVVISAATASGKTEAAFLPACSVIADQREGFGVLYLSPLKALINDQCRRLEPLCDLLDISATAWHGDASLSKKEKMRKHPNGIILITPESLESLLIRRSGWVLNAFSNLKYIIIDEYHAFLNGVRGRQLHSIMHRLESLVQTEHSIPRIALSATLGNTDRVMLTLRPNQELPCELILGEEKIENVEIEVRAYTRIESSDPGLETESGVVLPETQIANDLYQTLRGESHLVFANSRKQTETFALRLADLSAENLVPNEFFPHHGSLSKNIRESLEKRLQKQNLPTTAICTMTLELGIDIGKVVSVAQVNAPNSVASLRQRMGRSGRRNEASILRMFISERDAAAKKSVGDHLHLELLQSIAMIRLLMVEKWYEPADEERFHFSTLLHQILSVIAQWGGVRADQLWALLCKSGSFPNLDVGHFKSLLTSMGEAHLISQLSSDELVLGERGEKIVNYFTFYAVFKAEKEFQVVHGTKVVGGISSSNFIHTKQLLVLAGRRWEVVGFDREKSTILVMPAKAGRVPNFGGGPLTIHNRVRHEMFNILKTGEYEIRNGNQIYDYLDENAKTLFHDALSFFRSAGLDKSDFIVEDDETTIVAWKGDKIAKTLRHLLESEGHEAVLAGGIIYTKSSHREITRSLDSILRNTSNVVELARPIDRRFKEEQKFDHFLPDNLIDIGFAARNFDLVGALDWIRTTLGRGRD